MSLVDKDELHRSPAISALVCYVRTNGSDLTHLPLVSTQVFLILNDHLISGTDLKPTEAREQFSDFFVIGKDLRPGRREWYRSHLESAFYERAECPKDAGPSSSHVARHVRLGYRGTSGPVVQSRKVSGKIKYARTSRAYRHEGSEFLKLLDPVGED